MNEEIYNSIEIFCDSIVEENELPDGGIVENIELVSLSNGEYFNSKFSLCHFRGGYMIDIDSVDPISEDTYINKLLDNQCYN